MEIHGRNPNPDKYSISAIRINLGTTDRGVQGKEWRKVVSKFILLVDLEPEPCSRDRGFGSSRERKKNPCTLRIEQSELEDIQRKLQQELRAAYQFLMDRNLLRTSVATSESDCARAPCGDLTRGDRIPGMALRRYAGRHDRHASNSTKVGVRRSKLDERGRRVFAAGEVRATGWGGLEAVSEITGLARSTIGRGLKDLNAAPLPKGRVRRKGGGRRHLSSRDTTLIKDLRNVIEPATLGDPMRPLLWVSKSYDKLASALQKKGHEISASSVKRLLPTLGYSRQSNRKADEGSKHPDRNAQFEHINAKAIAAQAARQPVISVDTKKKELIGNYKNGGTDYRPKGDPRRVKVPKRVTKWLAKSRTKQRGGLQNLGL